MHGVPHWVNCALTALQSTAPHWPWARSSRKLRWRAIFGKRAVHMKTNGRTRVAFRTRSNPEWEKMKAVRRNIGHDDAVQESFFLQRQFRALWSDRMGSSPVDVNEILR